MSKGLVAKVSTTIAAPRKKAWDALVSPAAIKKYMFGAEVVSSWREGAPIVWKGEWKGKPYQDKGTIRRIEPEARLEYTHFSPLSGKQDVPKNLRAFRSSYRTMRPIPLRRRASRCRRTTSPTSRAASVRNRTGRVCSTG